jgi:tetratricopeptide (TPR) repeat protein
MPRSWCAVLLLLLITVALLPSIVLANPDELLNRSAILINEGKPSEALGLLHEAERRLPDPQLAAGLLGEAYLRLGMQQIAHGDDAAGREAFASAQRYLPDDPRPLQGMALAWMSAGQPAAALGPLHEAQTLAGKDPQLALLLGRAYYALGELTQAEEAWVEAAQAGSAEAAPLLEKVRRERQAEHNMSRDLAGRFSIAYAAGVSDALAATVLDVLQEAYGELGRDLGYYPETDIPVLLYAREDFQAVTRSPAWAGAVYDGKIRVPLGGMERMTPQLRALLFHEYTHVLVRFLGRGRVPIWLNEGLAELAGRRQFAPATSPHATQPLPPAALERPFTELPNELVPVAYAQSQARVERLAELCGSPALGELLRQLGNGLNWETAVAEAYAPCGYDWPRLQAEMAADPSP